MRKANGVGVEDAREIFALVVPLTLFAVLCRQVVTAARTASYSTVGRDQGIFQYIGWAISKGDTDYREIRDVNGPLVHLLHQVFLALGARDEHRFHVIDLTISAFVFALVGAMLPGVMAPRPYLVTEDRKSPHLPHQIAFALLGVVLFFAQYLAYLYWDLAQRESFCDWFVLVAAVTQMAASAFLATKKRLATAAMVLSAFLGGLACFGKPTYVLFFGAQALTLLIDPSLRGVRLKVLGWFSGGFALAAASMCTFVALRGDMRSFLAIYLHDAPEIYRFIWHRAAGEILELPWCAQQQWLAAGTTALLLLLMGLRVVPWRALPAALMAPLGLVSVIVQAKGFPYHFHPVSTGLVFGWMVLFAAVTEWLRRGERLRRVLLLFAIAALGGLLLLGRASFQLRESPHTKWDFPLHEGVLPETRETAAFFHKYKDHDFFPWEMRETAAYLKAHTAATDRVQIYGMDAYVLFLAERLSATPYIYAYDLNLDTAIVGVEGMLTGPDAAARIVSISAARDAHERDLLERMQKSPPAAFVFFDHAPLLSDIDSVADFEAHSPTTMAWLRERYHETAAFDQIHVWLPRPND